MLLILLLFVSLALAYFYFKSLHSYWPKRGIPILKPSIPFGNLRDSVIRGIHIQGEITKLYKAFEGHRLGGIYGFNSKWLLVRDPELVKFVIQKEFDHFHSRGVLLDDKDPLQAHLFNLSGARWRNLRIKLTPTFTSGKMRMMFPTLVECAVGLVNVLDEPALIGDAVEIKELLARYSTDVIASCAFGIQCNCLTNPDAEFRVWGRQIFKPTWRTRILRLVNFFSPSLRVALGLPLTAPEIRKYFTNMVRETVRFREENNVQRNDFLQLMIQLKNRTLTPNENESDLGTDTASMDVTMDVIAAQAFVFFAAGFETSSTTMTFCLYELSLNQDIQVQVQAEIDKVLKKYEGQVTYESVLEMEYLDKVVSETLRKYPPLMNLNRKCNNPVLIPGTDTVIEKDIMVFIPVMALHHDPKYYPDPERFDPERFSEEEKIKRPNFTYLPFGEGPRICIGMRFGMMQTKVGLIKILHNYKVALSKKTTIPVELNPKTFITVPLGGIWLTVSKRN